MYIKTLIQVFPLDLIVKACMIEHAFLGRFRDEHRNPIWRLKSAYHSIPYHTPYTLYRSYRISLSIDNQLQHNIRLKKESGIFNSY